MKNFLLSCILIFSSTSTWASTQAYDLPLDESSLRCSGHILIVQARSVFPDTIGDPYAWVRRSEINRSHCLSLRQELLSLASQQGGFISVERSISKAEQTDYSVCVRGGGRTGTCWQYGVRHHLVVSLSFPNKMVMSSQKIQF